MAGAAFLLFPWAWSPLPDIHSILFSLLNPSPPPRSMCVSSSSSFGLLVHAFAAPFLKAPTTPTPPPPHHCTPRAPPTLTTTPCPQKHFSHGTGSFLPNSSLLHAQTGTSAPLALPPLFYTPPPPPPSTTPGCLPLGSSPGCLLGGGARACLPHPSFLLLPSPNTIPPFPFVPSRLPSLFYLPKTPTGTTCMAFCLM